MTNRITAQRDFPSERIGHRFLCVKKMRARVGCFPEMFGVKVPFRRFHRGTGKSGKRNKKRKNRSFGRSHALPISFFFRHDGDGRWGRFAVNGFLVGFGSVVRGRGRRGETVECVRAMALGVSVLVRTGSIVLFVMFVSAVGCQQRAHSETFCSDKRRGRNCLGITLVERSSRKVE